MIFLILPLLLIIAQGIFAASETGFMSIDRIRVLKAKKENARWAIRMSYFLTRPERFFSTILVCDNFLLVIASTLFAKFFLDNFGGNGAILATILLSLFSLIVGQFIPKSMALINPDRTMAYLSHIVYYVEIITYPIVSFFAGVAKGLGYFFQRGTKLDLIRSQDIVHAMGEYEKKSSPLALRLFKFSKMVISDIMIPLRNVVSCTKDCRIEEILKRPGRLYTRIPVYEDEKHNIIGVLNVKDYFYANKINIRKPFFVNAQESCMALFSTMKIKCEYMAVVRDNAHRVVGIVTLEDLIEELIGEIRDEK